MHKCLPKFEHFLLFEFFFNNEAFNQKSGTVKLSGYVWTCSGCNIGPRKRILRMPRLYSEAHENVCVTLLWALHENIAAADQQFDFEKFALNAWMLSNWDSEHSRRVAKWFGIDIIHLRWIWNWLERVGFEPHFWACHTLFPEIQGWCLPVNYLSDYLNNELKWKYESSVF